MANCTCPDSLGNTGVVNCLTQVRDTIKLFVVPTYANDGTRNSITLSDTLDQDWLDDLINHTDESKRWRPLGEFDNVSDQRADNDYETFKSGRLARLNQGIRTFTCEFIGKSESSPFFAGVLEHMACSQMSVYMLDRDYNFIGMVLTSEDGKLYPIKLDNNSWAVKPVPYEPKTSIAKNVLSFNFHPDEKDSLLRWIVPAEYTCDFVSSVGLLDIFMQVVACTTTKLTAKLFCQYGTAITKQPLPNMLITDFYAPDDTTNSKLYNVTDSANVTITGVTETAAGTYELTYAAQTSTDVLRVNPIKNGYDFTAVRAKIVTVA